MNYSCDECGKFTKEDDLKCHHIPDSEFTSEEIYHTCSKCEEGYSTN